MAQQPLNQRLLRGCVVAGLLVACLGPAHILPARAQSGGSPAVRAANLARMKAESLNGGLRVYRPAPCMHDQAGGPCLVNTSSEGFTFRFLGGEPGWPQLNIPPTVETEILVSPDGRSIRQVIYNGPVRQGTSRP